VKAFLLPTIFIVVSGAMLFAVEQRRVPALEGEIARQTTEILLWVSCIFLAARMVAAVARAAFTQRTGHNPPTLLIDVIAATLWIGALSVMSVVELGISPSTAFATSGVLVAVVGFAVRSLVADLFYGITMAIERPFEIGNWIGLNDGIVGRVEEMTWRAVKIVTKDNVRVVVPNTQLAVEHIINYDQPEPFWRSQLRVTLDYGVQPDQVKQLLLATIKQVPASAAVQQQPEARIIGYNERGVDWELRYWVPDYPSYSDVNQQIQEAFLQRLRFAGIRIPRPREEIYVGALEQERSTEAAAEQNWIDQVELFSSVTAEDRLALQQRARSQRIEAGKEVVTQGDSGSSLFVVHEGTLEVNIADPSGATESAGMLGPGAVFGELSLLTGSPRSATVRASTPAVVHEITKADLEPLLNAHPELAERFAEVMADRRLADSDRKARSHEEYLAARASMVDSILGRAVRFFKLGTVVDNPDRASR
jgi:small-conductance mechanosensitive channel/CRP-like cAMP-binding protein